MIMNNKKEMNILYAIDEWKKDYSRYLWVSILSLLENNKEENVHIYILSQYIEESNKQELIRIVEKYWKKISFSEWEIIPEKFKKVLYVWTRRPIAMYYRWFFNKCFDIKDRVLYFDCDIIINKNLSEFYNTDFEWNVIIWQSDIDLTCYKQKERLWLEKYINSWALLINIDLFKEEELYNWVIRINKEHSELRFPDQDCVNIIYKDRIKLYNKLQLIVAFKTDYKYYDFLVIHTTNKPNTWWLTYCPNNIEKLFNKYLVQTKWKTYVWYRKAISIREYGCYVYDYWRNLITIFFKSIFWIKVWLFVREFCNYTWIYIWKTLRFLWFFKNQ